MPEDESLKRGDIVKTTNGIIGMVAGWIDDTSVAVLDLKDKETIISEYESDINLLVKVKDLNDLNFLPKVIKLTDNKPE